MCVREQKLILQCLCVYLSIVVSYYHVHKPFCYIFTPLVPQRRKWTPVFSALNVALLFQIRSTFAAVAHDIVTTCLKTRPHLQTLFLVFRFRWEARNTKYLFAYSRQTVRKRGLNLFAYCLQPVSRLCVCRCVRNVMRNLINCAIQLSD